MWGKKKKEKDQNTIQIKQKTKIKETIKVPVENYNPEVILPTKTSKLKEQQVITQPPIQTLNAPIQASNLAAVPVESNVVKRKVSRSSSSSSERNKKMNVGPSLSSSGNFGLIRDAPLVESNILPANIDSRYDTSILNRDSASGLPLGKNLYGETGLASNYYQLQQPFPGQTVYMEPWKQNISLSTREKFERGLNSSYDSRMYHSRTQNVRNPPLAQQNDTLYRETYQTNPNQLGLNQNNPNALGLNQNITNPLSVNQTSMNQTSMNQSSMNQQDMGHHKPGFFNRLTNIFKSDHETAQDSRMMESHKENIQTQPPLISQQNESLYRDTSMQNYNQSNMNQNYNQNYTNQSNMNQNALNQNALNQNYNAQTNMNQSNMNQSYTTPIDVNQPNLNQSSIPKTDKHEDHPGFFNRVSHLFKSDHDSKHKSNVDSSNMQAVSRPETTNYQQNNLTGGETVIKEKTKIKEKYHVPAEEVNRIVNVPTTDRELNSKMKQNETSFFNTSSMLPSNAQYSQQQPVKTSTSNYGAQQQNYNQEQYGTSNLLSNQQQGHDQYQVTNKVNTTQKYQTKGKNQGTKDETSIQQKTKIKQTYTVPAQNIVQPIASIPEASNVRYNQGHNQKPYQPFQAPTIPVQTTTVPVQSTTFGTSGGGDSKNLQYIQSKYGQNQYQTGSMPGQSSTLGGLQGESGMKHKRSYSSSSSSSDRNKRTSINANLGPSSRGNMDTMNQPLFGQPNYNTTGNIQSGYGPTGYDSNMYAGNTGGYARSNLPLGKNLYGETGYISPDYTLQQPYPGQTVYLPESPTRRTQRKFQRSIM